MSDIAKTSMPRVSVVIPMFNEEDNIGLCIGSILKQDYPLDRLEIIVIDGDSTDDSVGVIKRDFADYEKQIILRANPSRRTPRSLNIGLETASGDIIIVLGAHAELLPGFIEYNVENLLREDIHCCGGTLVNIGETQIQKSIAAAMRNPFAMASAPHRFKRKPGLARTAVFAAYKREVFPIVGKFEEAGVISEDAEFNWRLIQAGFNIWYDPRIRSIYYPRKTLRSLLRQMTTYGTLRVQMFRKHHQGLSWLHFVPPISILLFAGLAIGSLFHPVPLILLEILGGIYITLALFAALYQWIASRGTNPIVIVLAFPIIHFSWGYGFLRGLIGRKTKFTEFVRKPESAIS